MSKKLQPNVKLLRSDQWTTQSKKKKLSYAVRGLEKNKNVFDNIGLDAYFPSVNRAIDFRNPYINKAKRKKLKQEAAAYLSKEIKKIYSQNISSYHDFDAWITKAIDYVRGLYRRAGVTSYTIGNAQKLINMSIKFLLSSPSIKEDNGLFKYCHLPIDRIIQNKLFNDEELKIEKLNNPRWGELDDINVYMNYQKEVREKLNGYYSPLICEIAHWQ